MDHAHYDILIVGAGHSGAAAAIALRQHQFVGSLAVLGAEPDLPYQRPPLSKEYLAGEKPFERILIRPAGYWQEREVSILRGERAVRLDAAARVVVTDTGRIIGYGQLIWAAGGRARRLTCPGHDLAGVYTVRTRPDVEGLRRALATTRDVAVVGAGYIGLEAAAVLVKLGKKVTVIEAQRRVLARVAGTVVSGFYEAQHRRHGVDVRLDAAVEGIEAAGSKACGVRIRDGGFVQAGVIVVGIGIEPETEVLLAAGARGGNGVAVDENCRTSLPGVFAVGDCALHANAFTGGQPVRLESVQNANDMATTVAKAITGDAQPHQAVPWFWSNQYDLRLQTVGISSGHDEQVLRGDPASRSFSVTYLKQGRVLALDCVNATQDYVQGRALVAGRQGIPPQWCADPVEAQCHE